MQGPPKSHVSTHTKSPPNTAVASKTNSAYEKRNSSVGRGVGFKGMRVGEGDGEGGDGACVGTLVGLRVSNEVATLSVSTLTPGRVAPTAV